jgi:hypothetical protein
MPGWNTKRFAAYGLISGLAVLNVGLQLGCHKFKELQNFTDPPQLSYQTPLILATAGQPFTSVAPAVSAFYYLAGVGTTTTTGFSFSVNPALPDDLVLQPGTGVITGTPLAVSPETQYSITASNFTTNGGGTATVVVTLGVQASSPVALSYAGAGALSTAVGVATSLALPADAVSGGTPTGFGVSPVLPAGLVLNPTTGLISGIPTAATTGTTPYLLTVTTPQGSANCPFTLIVAATQPAAPIGLAYAGSPFTATVGTAFTGPAPTFTTAATDLVYTVSPALTGGLTLDPLLGVISGTPTATSAQAGYTITASNAGGSSPVEILLTVGS